MCLMASLLLRKGPLHGRVYLVPDSLKVADRVFAGLRYE